MIVAIFTLLALVILFTIIWILVESALNYIRSARKPSKKDISKKTEIIDYYPDPDEILIIEETVKNGFESPEDLLQALKKFGLCEDLDYYMVKNYIKSQNKTEQSE